MYSVKEDGQVDLVKYLVTDLENRYIKAFPEWWGNAGYCKSTLSIEDVIAMMEKALETGVMIDYKDFYDFDVDEMKALEARGICID